YLNIIVRSFIDFFKDDGIMLAGSLSYFSMMALLPLCLFLITIFGYFLGHSHEFYAFFSKRLISLFPDITSEITQELKKLIHFRGIGTFSIILYGLLSYQVFASLENAMNAIFKVKKRRSFFWSLVLSLVIVTLIITMLLISFTATSTISLLKAFRPMLPELRIGLITSLLIQYVIPFFTVLFTISIIYIFFPRTRVRFSHAFAGAFFTTVFLEIAKHIFTWYVGTVVKFGTIYGPLSAFVVFLLWVFYSICILLIGAEMVHNLGTSKKR
ncbi:MAG: YihY/virulence factor BrkB family protein, partial [Nitrospirota bacterium]